MGLREEYDALKAAKNQGALEVQYGDKRVKYRSLDEINSILDGMERQLGIRKTSGRRYFETSKGLT